MEEEPATDILDATYRALCEHGYADLTLQDIAAEANRSAASIHYHYESKDQLFVSVLDMLYEKHTERIATVTGDTPREELTSMVELLLSDDPSEKKFRTAMLELSAQAPYDSDVRKRLTEFDEFLYERFQEIFETGVTTGEFSQRIDPSLAAELFTAAVTGAGFRQVAVHRSPDQVYTALTGYAETQLFDDGSAEATQ